MSEYPRLCGGTFFTLLLQARKQRTKAREHRKGERDGLSDIDMLVGLIKVLNPDYIEPTPSVIGTFKTNTSAFKSCRISSGTYLPFANTAAFDNRVKTRYATPLRGMCEFTDSVIDVRTSAEKDIRLVKALLELIEVDQSIDSEQGFYICEDGSVMTKASLRNEISICLPAFLLGVWHFELVDRKDNTVGRATYDNWCPPNGGAERKYIGSIGDAIARAISVTTPTDLYTRVITPEGRRDVVGGNGAEPHEATETVVEYNTPTPELQEISCGYYNLFVVGDEIKNGRFSMARDRFLKGDSTAVKMFADLSDEAVARVKTLPSLIMNENTEYGGRTAPEQEAYYGFITDLRIQENGLIKVRFRCVRKINQQRINDIAHLLDIFGARGVMELNYTHWTIKNVDLIEELTEAGLLPSECRTEGKQ